MNIRHALITVRFAIAFIVAMVSLCADAQLIANGSPEEIKAKLHRMSPEMRKIALSVLEP